MKCIECGSTYKKMYELDSEIFCRNCLIKILQDERLVEYGQIEDAIKCQQIKMIKGDKNAY